MTTNEKECLMVLITGHANGELAPPFIVLKYNRLPQALTENVWQFGV